MSNLVPHGWNECCLKDVSTVITKGTTPTTYGSGYTQSGIKFIRVENISNGGFINESDLKFISAETHETLKRSQLKVGDLLVSIAGAIGRSAIVGSKNIPANTNQAVGIVRLRSDEIIPDFARYSIESPVVAKQISDSQAGNAQVNLNLEQLGGLRLYRPPLPEQQKIAIILSSVDDVIEKTHAQIDKLKDLKTGMMQELLTKGIGHTEFKDSPVGRIPADWDVVELGDICNVQGGYAFKSTDAADSGCRWLKIANVGKGKAVWNDKSFLPYTFMLQHKNFMLEDGDIVLALTRPVISGELKVARMTLSDVPALLNQRVARAIPNPQRVSSDYLFALFSWAKLANDIETEIFGTDPPNVSTKQIESFRYAIPPRNEQQLIANSIFSISNRIDLTCKKLAQLLSTKKALMQDLLTGKVRVKLTDLGTETAS